TPGARRHTANGHHRRVQNSFFPAKNRPRARSRSVGRGRNGPPGPNEKEAMSMNSVERLIRSRHLVGALADAPIKGLQIREGLVALDEATGEVRHDRALRQHANDAVRECSARVRDATRLARTECKKGRALLVARGVPLEPHATDDGTGSRNVLARAEVLLERAKAAGVPLTA